MKKGEVVVNADELTVFGRSAFIASGCTEADSELWSEVLVWANLRGVDSHGVLRIPSYIEQIEKGGIRTRPDIRILNETPAVVFMEADRAPGPVATMRALDLVIAKAKTVGIGWGLIQNITHQGAIGYYALAAAKHDAAGLAMVCNPPNMAPFGAKAAGLHNSPLAIAVPAKRHRPMILDMATSVAAGGKLNLALDKGVSIPEGWALDKDGNPTTDPGIAQILLPFGGHKGSGLALMFECLTSLFAGNPLLSPVLNGADGKPVQNAMVAAVDIGTFSDPEIFKNNVDELIDSLKALPKADGFDEIFVPGEPESRTYESRKRDGILLPDGTKARLSEIARRFGLSTPWHD